MPFPDDKHLTFTRKLTKFAYQSATLIVISVMITGFFVRYTNILKFSILSVFLLMSVPSAGQFYQGYQTNFGKNRVQYNEFYWTFYRFKNFDTYFYVGGKELAAFVGKSADKEIEEIEKIFDYRINGRLQFMIYNKYSDLRQTNIGLEGDEVMGNTGGLTRVMGNKVLIYFDGNHDHLRQQIRAGVAQVLFHQLLYGGNVKDRIQSAVLLTIPAWYEKGLIAYLAKGWGSEEDNKMRDGILSGRYSKFNHMLETEAEFAGQSMWHYIVQTYGMTSISNLLYMTRVNRSIESGFVNVIGVNLKRLSANWLTWNRKFHQTDEQGRFAPEGTTVLKKTKPSRVYHHLRISPDGKYAAYVSNDIGKYRVHVTDLEKGKTRRVTKGGYRTLQHNPDNSFPLLAWHPTGQHLTVMREKKGLVWMEYHKPKRSKPAKEKFFYFDKVLNINYAPNGQEIVLSGVQKGQSDIFVYSTRGRTSVNLTNDFYDDLQPSFSADGKEIYFVSNRVSDTLAADKKDVLPPNSNLDVFSVSYPTNNGVLRRITNTPLADEMQPLAADSGRVYYLSDASGVYNRYAAVVDSTISHIDTVEHYRYYVETFPQTNYSRGVLEHAVNARQSRYAEIFLHNGRYRLQSGFMPRTNVQTAMAPNNTQLRQQTARRFMNERKAVTAPKPVPVVIDSSNMVKPPKQEVKETTPRDTSKIDINNYVFQSEFSKPKPKVTKSEPVTIDLSEKPKAKEEPVIPVGKAVSEFNPDSFMLPKQRNYDIAFATDYFVTQLDNSLQNSTYQAFTGSAFYFDPGLNVLIKVGIADLFNDYKISGGFRLSGDLNSNEYFMQYDNLKKRVDKTVAFFRQAREYAAGFSFFKVHTHEVKGQLKFPFNDLASVRGSMSFRTDRIVALATDATNLQEPNVNNYWGSAKVEYVYDNTINRGLNLYNGMRYKIFAEAFRQIDRKETWLGVVGIDFRHYQKIHRQIILASRFAASTSLGDEKLVYYLGSQDNAIIPTDNFDYSIPIDYSQNYVFQAVATNMRGFLQNIRNGSSFALVNNEIRIPIFQYLVNKPIRSDFVRNFQAVGFFDIGTAWTGSSPFAKNNTFNTEIINGNPVTVVLDRQVSPIVAGFGAGLRTRLFGYFIRTDWAWGYEDGVVGDNIFYLSLGLDF